MGIVSGRRRQGKSFLLEALAEQTGGIYFAATEGSEPESLRMFAGALAAFTGTPPEPFRDWNDAISAMFLAVRDRPVPVVIDEFPFLSRVSPGLPSIIQRELGPGGSGTESSARLLLCGSAMSVMGKLLSGQAPLRGRASLELIVQPFGYRAASRFWGIDDPRLAVQLHAIVGGTPAYRGDFVDDDTPEDLADFDSWVTRTVLSPRMPLFREARYLLAEEADIRDPALYHAVLAAIAAGNTANGQIASHIGRKADQLAHPLAVLEDCGLVAREPDLFRSNRYRYRIAEPLITFYEAIMRKRWSELERRRAEQVWADSRRTFTSKIVGPHFEQLCREFSAEVDDSVFGEFPSEVGAGVVNDPENRTQIEIDVAVLAAPGDGPRGVLALGEAKWGETMGVGHVARLSRARDLLAVKGWDTRSTKLACYSGAGFTDELRTAAAADGRILLIDLEQIYRPE
ncbi:ATP-binding protein [Actinokineospora sp. HUAS TT18]|uniref:ATP-binding protein n=1 Tax=Actinokineospora sp. HUAS TT18 TaxID=3447451 RepID=UPI003F51D0F8